MKLLSLFLSTLVFALALFCGAVLVQHISQFSPSEVRNTQGGDVPSSDPTVKDDGSSWNLSKLSLLPQWGKQQTLVSVMVENHEEARPHHRGLEDAVLIQEFFVEGFISRLNALFSVKDLPRLVGPVRSLRPYFVDSVLPLASVFFHIGGSPEALERIEELELTSFNGIYRDTYYERQDGVPMPHDAFLSKASAKELLEEVSQLNPVSWPPYKTGRAPEGYSVETIFINFFSPFHNVEYVYDSWKKSYIRKNGEEVSAALPRNVLFLETEVEEIGPFGRLRIAVEGEGDALLFRAGRIYTGRWSKDSATGSYLFTDALGDPLIFASGQTWMTVVDSLDRVSWE